MPAVVREVASALRFLKRAPGFALATSLTLAIGIGSVTLVAAWVDSLILNPLPRVPEYARLVSVNGADADGTTGGAARVNYPDFQEWRRRTTSFDGLAAAGASRLGMRANGVDAARPVWGLLVTGDYFELLRVPALRGRTLTPDDDARVSPVVVLGHALWQSAFRGDPKVLGTSVLLNGVGVEIVGVMPPAFYGHEMGYQFDLFLPASVQPQLLRGPDVTRDRSVRWLAGIGRLKAATQVAEAKIELERIGRAVSSEAGDRPVTIATAIPMREWRGGGVFFPLLMTLLSVSVIVLLLSWATVATLVTVRSLARRHEFAVRLSMGGTGWQVVRLSAVEACVVASIGGAFAIVFANVTKPAIAALAPISGGPVGFDIRLSGRAMGVAFAMTIVAALVAGVLPALRVSRRASRLAEVLRVGGRSLAAGGGRGQTLLVSAQIALACIGLVLASLFARSLDASRRVDVGFKNPAGVLVANLDFGSTTFSTEEARAAMRRLLEKVGSVAGVQSVSSSTMVPLGFGGHRMSPVRVDGYVAAPNESMTAEVAEVETGYFALMQIGLVDGRPLDATDVATSLPAAVVNETMARRYYGGSAVGRTVDLGKGPLTIVGVARDGRYNEIREGPRPTVFTAWQQQYRPTVVLHVRTSGAPHLLERAVRDAVQAVSGALTPTDFRTVEEHMQASTFVQRLGGLLLGALGTMALLIAIGGLYGVLSFFVRQRARDFAMRVAIGATPTAIQRYIMGHTFRLVLYGMVPGMVCAYGISRAASGQLTGVAPVDVLTYAGVSATMLVVALSAAIAPARRAARVNVTGLLSARD